MLKKDTKIRSSEGPEFNCYVVTPEKEQKVPAVVLASAIHGVDKDLRGIADEFASHGYIAVAPDLFWRTVPGPLVRDDPRSAPRGQPRLEKIKTGERDLADVLPVAMAGEWPAELLAEHLTLGFRPAMTAQGQSSVLSQLRVDAESNTSTFATLWLAMATTSSSCGTGPANRGR